MQRFRICDECARHVRANEAGCPFCGHALSDAALPPLVRAPAQLSRAQRIAFVAAIASGPMLAACGDDDMAKSAQAVPIYGAPVPPQQVAGSGGDAGSNGGAAGARPTPVPVYGAPVPAPAGRGGGGAAGASGSSGKAGAGASGGTGSAAGQSGGGGSAGKAAAGQSGGGGSAGKAAAGSGGHMVVPVYGASPAYGVPPLPSK